MWYTIEHMMNQRWLIVHPTSMLWALDQVAQGKTPEEVLLVIFDMVEDDPDSEETSEDG